MHLSGHAEKRSQQGGRRLRNIEFVVEYGDAPLGAMQAQYTRIEKPVRRGQSVSFENRFRQKPCTLHAVILARIVAPSRKRTFLRHSPGRTAGTPLPHSMCLINMYQYLL